MDFRQDFITTIHDFGGIDERAHADRLARLARKRPLALVIPALYAEFERPALARILAELEHCAYLDHVVLVVGQATEQQFQQAQDTCRRLPQRTTLLWENGPALDRLKQQLVDCDVPLNVDRGKGLAVWWGLGLATRDAYAVAIHDADVLTYDRNYTLRLLYPILDPDIELFYVKGYYARVNREQRSIHGRITRLFLWPLLGALLEQLNYDPVYLHYLNAFRYPLAGEFAMTADLAQNIRVPADWGLEVGLLSEVYLNAAQKRIGQVDLGFYDHKHQSVGAGEGEGLLKMAHDIYGTILRHLTEFFRVEISPAFLLSVRVKYRRIAQSHIRQYYADTKVNGLRYDRHQEEGIMEALERVLDVGGGNYMRQPFGAQIPNWNRVETAMPDILDRLAEVAD